jgi:hypothetical protein
MLDRLFRIVAVYMVINLVVKQFLPSDVLEGLGKLDASTSAGEVARAPSQPAAPKQPVVYRPFGNYGEPFHIQFSQQLPSTQDDPTTTASFVSTPKSPSSSPKQRLPKKHSLLIPLPAPVEPQWSDLFPLIPPLWARQDTLREMEASASAVELMLLEEHDTQLLGEVTLPVDVSHCYWLSSSTPLTTSGNEAPSSSVAAETVLETDRLSENQKPKTSAIDDVAATSTTTTKDSAVLVGHYCSINVTATMTLRGKSHTLTIPLVFSRNRSTVLLSQLPGASPRAANYRFRHVVNLDLITDAAVAAEVQQGIIPTHWFVPPSDFRMPEPSSVPPSDAAAAKKLPPVMVPHFPILLVRTGWDTPKLVKPWSSVLQRHGRVAYATFRNGSSSSSSSQDNNKAPTEGDAADVVRHEDDSSSAAAGAPSWQRSAQPILMNVTLKLRSRALRGAVADYQLDSMLEKFPVLDNTEDTRRIFLEGDPLLLMITMFAMLLHMIFEGLALKNDVSYWRNRQVFTGISLRTLLIEFYVSLIVFCYLMLPSCPSASEAAGAGVLMNAVSASSGSSIAPKEAPTSFLLSFAAMVSNLVSANHNDTSITSTSATVHSPSSTTDAAPRESATINSTNNNNSSFYFQYSSDELSSASATQTFFETRNKQQLLQQQQQSLKDASAQAADSVVSMVNAEHHSATTIAAESSLSSSSSTSSFKYSDFVGCRHTTRDDDTSLLILVPQGLSVLMCIWKICKAFHISIGQTAAATTTPATAAAVPVGGEQKQISGKDNNNKINNSDVSEKPREWISVSSNNDKDTQAYDKLAVGVLLKITGPTLLLYSCYTYYQEIYSVEEEHSRTYIVAWLLTTQVRFIYIFGFIQMTPQLFINYKLKSVVHLPWRTFVYKALNTVVDDLFAFAVRMPFLHRIACFRDDIVFVILLYQRWIYPVDQKRTESGFVREEAGKEAEEMTQQKAVLQLKKQE